METKTKITLTRTGETCYHMHLHTMVMPENYQVHKTVIMISKSQFDKMTSADEYKEQLKDPNCLIHIE